MTQKHIYNLCKKNHKQIFWILTKEKFKLAKIFFGQDWEDNLKQLVLNKEPLKVLKVIHEQEKLEKFYEQENN